MDDKLALADINLDVINESLSKITEHQKKVGKIQTPKGLVKKKMGFDYVELSYMKKIANEQYPGWSWTIVKSEAMGTAAYLVHGRLKWFDNGIWREGDMVAAHRIQKKRDSEEFVEIGNDVKSANTDCLKKAFNVYMNIAADVYRSDDPTLDDEQINTLLTLAEKCGNEEVITEQIANGAINTYNYSGSKSKLERMVKNND